jgi:glycine betaine/proline transport system ATP-binding protein
VGTPERIITEPRTAYVADFVAHADPTGVMTAGTVAVDPEHARVDLVRREGTARVLAHRTQPDVEIVVDPAGAVIEVRADGGRADTVPIDVLLESAPPVSRYRDRAAVVGAERPLRLLLEARNRCNLPVLVVDGADRLVGLVTEREVIHAIIAKRGPNGDGTEAIA